MVYAFFPPEETVISFFSSALKTSADFLSFVLNDPLKFFFFFFNLSFVCVLFFKLDHCITLEINVSCDRSFKLKGHLSYRHCFFLFFSLFEDMCKYTKIRRKCARALKKGTGVIFSPENPHAPVKLFNHAVMDFLLNWSTELHVLTLNSRGILIFLCSAPLLEAYPIK